MIEQLFGSKTRTKLLYLFFQFPDKAFYVREISRQVGSQLNAVRREIANLESIGLIGIVPSKKAAGNDPVRLSNAGRSKYYKLKKDCLLYLELKSLLLKAQVLREREMVEKIRSKAGKLKLMILTGEFTQAKDIETDILLVGQIKPLVITKLIKSFEGKLGKPVRYTIMTEDEYTERKEIGDKFLYSIFESKNVMVVDEL